MDLIEKFKWSSRYEPLDESEVVYQDPVLSMIYFIFILGYSIHLEYLNH